MAGTLLKLGYSNPLTDSFGAHPILGPVLDLNDGATYTLLAPEVGGIELQPPPRTIALAGNIRTQGERATRALYRHNRTVRVPLLLGPMSSYAALTAALRELLQWVNAAPQVPMTLLYQPPNATQPVYLDIVGAAHSLPADESDWLRLQLEPVELVFVCRPGLRGDRITLQNLVSNPGFEQGSGPGVPVFTELFANLAAYTQVAGSAPTLAPANTFVDALMANGGSALLAYYRLDETSGTAAYDIAGQGYTGTTHGSPTQNVAGLLSGDTDACYTFASASSQYVSVPSTAVFPSGNSPLSVGVWFKIASAPAATAQLWSYGDITTGHHALSLYLATTGKLTCDVGAGASVLSSASAVSNAVAHFAALTWDGTTLTLWLDGVSQGTATPGAQSIPTTPTVNLGANATPAAYFSGQLDEACLWSAALSSTQIANIYTAGHSGASGTLASAFSLPVSGQVSFGSAQWASVNAWQLRFRYTTGLTLRAFLHYVDGNNYVQAQVTGTQLSLAHKVGGTFTTIQTVTVALTYEGWYWLQCTQFPTVNATPTTQFPNVNANYPYLTAAVTYDDNGAVGAQIAAASGPAVDVAIALTGKPQMLAQGAALVVGGNVVNLFGPGGWSVATGGGAGGLGVTSVAIGSWEQASANLPPLGLVNVNAGNAVQVPVTSYGCARLDIPAGSTALDARWQTPTSGFGPNGLIPLPGSGGAGVTLAYAFAANSTGFAGTARVQLYWTEYTAAGAALGTYQAASVTPPAGWQGYASTFVTQNAGCAAISIFIRILDAATGTSVGAVLWLDNVQVWSVSSTGLAVGSMPYCELRFPQSPAQVVLSGLLGDLPCPAALSFGAYLTSLPQGGALSFAVGRSAQPSATARLTAAMNGFYGSALGAGQQATAALDATAYGGYTISNNPQTGWSAKGFAPLASDAPGVYHLLERFLSTQSVGNLPNVQVRANTQQRLLPWFGASSSADQLGNSYGPYAALLSASNTWTIVDTGQVTLPPYSQGAMTDPTQTYLVPHPQWQDLTAGGAMCSASWCALLPIDGSLIVGVVNNPSNAASALSNTWLWTYFDGLLVNRAAAQDAPGWLYSLEAVATPNAAHAGGGPGTQGTGNVNVNSGADPYLILDPTSALPQTGQAGVNQLVAYVADQAGAVLGFAGEVSYSPLYLWPR
ncbi:MAG: hypothetical protein OJF49_002763 [Ktedonobacterales bacterium]|jgi:hypothetical protein|nr:MAG: hypothetical protein OJF49_002763 [Ktedonobacterales bacterium]